MYLSALTMLLLGTFFGLLLGWLKWSAVSPPAPLPKATASYLTGPWR